MDECIHGIERTWCGICSPSESPATNRSGSSGLHGGETKQDVLDDITDILGLPRAPVSVGSSLPSDVFLSAARQVGVEIGSMPQICERIVRAAGNEYSPSFDSRGSVSGGGSTVTLEGAQAMRTALRSLLART